MEYYEAAAKWWKEQVCNLDECKTNEKYKEAVIGFENHLAAKIKNKVDEHESMLITSDNDSKGLFQQLSKMQGIRIKNIPEEIIMFIRPHNVTVITGRLGNRSVIYQCKQQV